MVGPRRTRLFPAYGATARRSFTAAGIGYFTEARAFVNMQLATKFGTGASAMTSLSTVGVILTDMGHQSTNTSKKDLNERRLETHSQASDVTLFQTILWNHLDIWEDRWKKCLGDAT